MGSADVRIAFGEMVRVMADVLVRLGLRNEELPVIGGLDPAGALTRDPEGIRPGPVARPHGRPPLGRTGYARHSRGSGTGDGGRTPCPPCRRGAAAVSPTVCPWTRRCGAPCRRCSTSCRHGATSASTQPSVFVTAFFQLRYSRSRSSAARFGVQRLPSCQLRRRSWRLAQ